VAEHRLLDGVALVWEPPPAALLDPVGATIDVAVRPLAYPDLGRATAAAVTELRARRPGTRIIDLGEPPLGGRPATRVLLHVLAPAGPVCREEWRVEVDGRVVVLGGECPVAAYDTLADAFAAAAGSLRAVA
jgi:hypothetical protein